MFILGKKEVVTKNAIDTKLIALDVARRLATYSETPRNTEEIIAAAKQYEDYLNGVNK